MARKSPRVRCGDAMMAFGADLRVIAWNHQAERLTGLAAEQAVGRFCWEALGAVDEASHLVCHPDCSIARACREGHATRSVKLLVRVRGGRTLVDLSTVSLLCNEERLFVHTLREAEPRRAAERLEAPLLLTPRQREVLGLLAEGMTTEAIASSLTLSRATVRNHVRAILARLGCHSRLEAVARGRRLGLI